jgi:hypothetical protein
MTDLVGYYEESYPPSILNYSTGATAGIPGTWTPANSIPPDTVQDLITGHWVTVVASPATPWTTGQYVQTATEGPAGRATWTGTNWVGGAAPLAGESETPTTFKAIPVSETPTEPETPEPEPVPEPEEPDGA